MFDPFKNNDRAFSPMFDERMKITIRDTGVSQTIKACVFDDSNDDPLNDNSIDTDRELIQILCNVKDWEFVKKLVRGDFIERMEFKSKKYSVLECDYSNTHGMIIRARSL